MITVSTQLHVASGRLIDHDTTDEAGITNVLVVADYIFRVNGDNVVLNGSTVSQMNNLGSNAINLVQGTTAYQPTIVTNAANGHAAISVDATDDFMTCRQFSLTGDFTQFYVYKQATLPGKLTFFNNNQYQSTIYAYDELFYINYGPGVFRQWTGMAGSTDYCILMIKRIGSNHYAYINGILVSSVLGFGTGTYDITTAFKQESFKNTSTLYILDATMFNYALTDEQATPFYTLLKNTYGL